MKPAGVRALSVPSSFILSRHLVGESVYVSRIISSPDLAVDARYSYTNNKVTALACTAAQRHQFLEDMQGLGLKGFSEMPASRPIQKEPVRVKRSRKEQVPTHTSKVSQALAECEEDFLSIRMLVERTGSTYNQVNAALFSMRKMGAVDVVVEDDGEGWWFITPADDTRTKTVDLRTPEEQPRSKRKGRIVKVKKPD